MADTLRERIAAALDKALPQSALDVGFYQRLGVTPFVDIEAYDLNLGLLADAVIAGLGLQPEYCVRHESGGGHVHDDRAQAHHQYNTFVERPPGVEDPGSGQLTGVEIRWVTSWKADDE